MKPTFVLYHSNCPDGFAAAWAVWMHLHEFSPELQASYIPVNYQQPLPEIPDGSDVVIVDFSYPREVIEELAARCRVLVLDHHPTAKAALHGLACARFEEHKCGAVMAWEHFFPTRDVPELLLYIQDRDLWQWRMPRSKQINAALWKGTPRDFSRWKDILYLWDKGVTTGKERLIEAGEILATYDAQTVEMLCRHPHWQRILHWTVPAVASPVLQSEIGHQLLQLHPSAPFAAIYMTLDDGTYAYSLRSRTDDFDVSVVAKEFGGGGHKPAAGFRVIDRFTLHAKEAKDTEPAHVIVTGAGPRKGKTTWSDA